MYKAILSYDGTRYFGWQKTITGPSIQEELQKALTHLTGESPLPEAASRTDRGVHAKGQVVQFTLSKPWAPSRLQKALNAVLPPDIRLLHLEPLHFHPTLDAIGKEYHYHLCLGPVEDPIRRLYTWHIHLPLDLAAMNREVPSLLGTHDFTAFANEAEKDPTCTLESIEITSERIVITGDRFLYKMVRTLVGTLVYIGYGKLSNLSAILASRNRAQAGITAPAHGLHLHQVFYPVN